MTQDKRTNQMSKQLQNLNGHTNSEKDIFLRKQIFQQSFKILILLGKTLKL